MEYQLKMFIPFTTTGIGSLPHRNPIEACNLVLRSFDIPFWPQLPQLSFRELMIPQYSEGIPFLKIDEGRQTIWIERDGSDALERFYGTYTEDLKLPVSESHAQGFHAFLRIIRDMHFAVLKGHVTGPLTFTLGLKDNKGRLVYFDEELREISLLVLKSKIRWQIDELKPFADRIIIFIDEPVLSALGSSGYLGVSPEEALRLLRETSEFVWKAGGIPGIHCCSRADWPLVINSGVNIISFDAYDYLETVSLYPLEFREFLGSGGYLAWGIVPTTDAILEADTVSIKKRFEQGIELLSENIPTDLLLSRIILTPSCGTGSMNVEEAEKVFRMLGELKVLLVDER